MVWRDCQRCVGGAVLWCLSKRYFKCCFVNFLPENPCVLLFSYAFVQDWPSINCQRLAGSNDSIAWKTDNTPNVSVRLPVVEMSEHDDVTAFHLCRGGVCALICPETAARRQ